jgi:hypothetical protein
MIERADGHRVLLAPTRAVGEFVAATYRFDEVRIRRSGSASVRHQCARRWSG